MNLRYLEQGDEAVVKPWLRAYLKTHIACWTEAYGTAPHLGLDEVVEKNWRRLLEACDKGYFVKLAESDVPVGIVHALVREDDYLGYGLGVLAWIYVTPEARGQTVSSQLMDAAIAWMRSRHVKGREVYVTAQNSAAVRLYERYGYRIVDHRMLAKS